jgi:hypothetical protein
VFGKWGLLVLAALASAAVLTSSAGAVSQGSARINLSTRAGVSQYLASLGVDARGIVVQRGAHNYVGANCPGRGWTCTTDKRVLQIAAGSGNGNTFVCTPSTGGSATAPGDCVIVQVSSGGTNSASCQESSADPNADQSCQISQSNTTGSNSATINQAVNTGSGSSQSPTQYAGVLQSNGGGANTVTLGQGVTAQVNQVDASGTQTQDAHQGVYISQFNTGTGTNAAGVNQSQSLKAVAQQRPSLTQNQNTDGDVNTNVSLSQTSGSGANTANVNQSNVYIGNVQQAASAFQQQGSPGAGEAEFFTQDSTGVSTLGGNQAESQTQRADRIGALTQNQYGPMWADPDQGSNTGDKYNLSQSSVQNATNPSIQDDNEYARCDTTGSCTANQSISQNGATSTNTCTDTSCDIGNSLTFNGEGGHQSDTCGPDNDGSCTPSEGDGSLPPPPPFPPAFFVGCGIDCIP